MIKIALTVVAIVASFFISPALTLLLLGVAAVYIFVSTLDSPDYTSTAQYGIMSFSSKDRISPQDARPKDYHDYQIEAYLNKKQNLKAMNFERATLSEREEEILKDLEKQFSDKNDS